MNKISNIEIIKHYEGCKLDAYLCPANVWTIGVGHTKNVQEGQEITQLEADNLLIEDLEYFETELNKLLKSECLELYQNQFDALVSFCFNAGGHAFSGSGLFKTIKESLNYDIPISNISQEMKFLKFFPECFTADTKDLHIIMYQFLNWTVGLRGLYRRRVSEGILYLYNRIELF